jgi:hypothetical protein
LTSSDNAAVAFEFLGAYIKKLKTETQEAALKDLITLGQALN